MHADPIQNEIDAKATAPRVTTADLEAEIVSEHYFTGREGILGMLASDGVPPTPYERANMPAQLAKMTFCILILRNGLAIAGVNHGPVCPENFNADEGRQYARENALEQLWQPLGFRLADKLAAQA